MKILVEEQHLYDLVGAFNNLSMAACTITPESSPKNVAVLRDIQQKSFDRFVVTMRQIHSNDKVLVQV